MNGKPMSGGRKFAREGRAKDLRPKRLVFATQSGECTVLRMRMLGEIWECHVIGWSGLDLETWLKTFTRLCDYKRTLAVKEQEERGSEVFWFRGYDEWRTDQVLTMLRRRQRYAA